MMNFGKDEVNGIGLACACQNTIQPRQLHVPVVRPIRIETYKTHIAIILPPPVLFVPLGPILRKVKVLKVILCIRLVVAQHRIHRNLANQVCGILKEIILPLPIRIPSNHKVTRNEHQCQIL